MGYQDKAWVAYEDKPLVGHVIEIIKPQVDKILISENKNHPGWQQSGLECFSDEESLGPLSGILACTPAIQTPLTLVVPCDIPNLPTDLVQQLHNALGTADLVVAWDDHGQQNLVFLAKSTCLDSISSYLKSGNRSVRRWIDTQAKTKVRFRQSFDNINESRQLR